MGLGRALLLGWVAAAPAIAWAASASPAVSPAATAAAAATHWRQLERRIETAYFQQDAAALQALDATLPVDAAADTAATKDAGLQNYYGALLVYRLALLAKGDEARAWPFAQQCYDRLNRALVIDPDSAEALALQSACLALQSHLDAWRAPLAAPLSRARIDKALKLAPDNPRVLLLAALADRDLPRLFGGDTQQGFVLLQRAVSAFERQRRPGGLPAWGAADAFTDLAQDYLTRGEALAARNVLERALLVAPDFTPARNLMAEIVSG